MHPNKQQRVKTMFVSEVLTETAMYIRSEQLKVVEEWDLFEGGALKQSLTGHFSVNHSDGGGRLSMRYLNYARFLDMPDRRNTRRLKREGYHLYNRIVYGILYNRTIPVLKYGFTEEIKKKVSKMFDSAMTSRVPAFKRNEATLKLIADEDRNMAAMLAKSLRQGYR
jgi:hypothetical protein